MAYNGSNDMTPLSPRKRQYIVLGLMASMIIISVGGSVLLIQHWEFISELEEHGYWGLFVISLFAGSPIPIPTPSMILTFTLGSILNPVLVGLVSGFGNAVGNAFIFWAGHGGKKLFQNISTSVPEEEKKPPSRIGRFLQKLTRMPEFMKNRVLWAVYILSIYPNPLLTPLILGMGAMRFRFWKFFLVIWAGKTAQGMLLSYLGYFGLRSLLRYLGIFDAP
jgi:membrane protein YqaA with SNARE-associated domain